MKDLFKDKGMGCLVAIIMFLLALAFSWAVSIGVIYLIYLCFHWQFHLLTATGIWLIMLLLSLTLNRIAYGRSNNE